MRYVPLICQAYQVRLAFDDAALRGTRNHLQSIAGHRLRDAEPRPPCAYGVGAGTCPTGQILNAPVEELAPGPEELDEDNITSVQRKLFFACCAKPAE